MNALIPARTLAETAKALANGQGVTLALAAAGEGLIGFEGNGRRTTTRLLDGEFPKYRTLLPSESAGVATIEVAALTDAVKRVALVAERNTPVRLSFEGSEVILRAGTGEDAQANEAVESLLDGDDIEIAFNPTYLLDGLAALDAPYARMSFTQSTRPAVLTGAADPTSELRDDYRYLLMPVRLTG
jgi:DNA polymerase-3 subunit beta